MDEFFPSRGFEIEDRVRRVEEWASAFSGRLPGDPTAEITSLVVGDGASGSSGGGGGSLGSLMGDVTGPASANELTTLDVTLAVAAGVDQRFFFSTDTTLHSGMRGLSLVKDAANTEPLGLTLYMGANPVWDIGMDATVEDYPDLVLAYSHQLQTDNLRMRADTAQLNLARITGKPSLVGSQLTIVAGNAATITGISNANPMVISVGASHLFAVGEIVNFVSIAGALGVTLNGTTPTITAVGATTITFGAVDSTAYAAYSGGGTAYVTMNGIRLTSAGNSNGLAFFQSLSSTVTKRVKMNFGNFWQAGVDANQVGGTAGNDFWWFNNQTGRFAFYLGPDDQCYIGGGLVGPTPTAKLHIAGGEAAASKASLKLDSGTLQTTAEVGAIEFASSALFFTPSGTTRKKVALVPTAPTAFTQTFSTASHTMGAYTSDPESAAYVGVDNLQVGTPYATVADLNQLRVAYETLRGMAENAQQVLNGLLDDLQAAAIVG